MSTMQLSANARNPEDFTYAPDGWYCLDSSASRYISFAMRRINQNGPSFGRRIQVAIDFGECHVDVASRWLSNVTQGSDLSIPGHPIRARPITATQCAPLGTAAGRSTIRIPPYARQCGG